MNTYVQRAVPLPPDGTLLAPQNRPLVLTSVVREAALPEGFPFLVCGKTGQIIEPVLLWMMSFHQPRRRRRWEEDTALAQINALKNFWLYLDAIDVSWNEVDELDLERYRDGLDAIISAHTHRQLAASTKKARLIHVLAFYDWAREVGLFTDEKFSKRKVGVSRRINNDPLIHVRSTGGRQVSSLLPKGKGLARDDVSPFSLRNIQQVLTILGPLYSEHVKDPEAHPRPSRDRLVAELGLRCGLRIDEVAQLRVYQIQDLSPTEWGDHDLGENVHLHLTETKGLYPRRVLLPTWLLKELDIYITTERHAAVKAASRRSEQRREKFRSTNALFVNGLLAKANVGKQLHSKTISFAFHRAIMDSGLTSTTENINPETGEKYLGRVARHSFHDLRHTFAVWKYHEERANGNVEPWKVVQALLGHRDLATTLRFYLRAVSSDERVVSDGLSLYMRDVLEGGRI